MPDRSSPPLFEQHCARARRLRSDDAAGSRSGLPRHILSWMVTALVLSFTPGLIAQQPPEAVLGSRPCLTDVHAGVNSSHGQADALGILLGGDYCRQVRNGIWKGDADLQILKTSDDPGRQRLEIEAVRERTFRRWVFSTFGSGKHERSGRQTRFLAGGGVGQQRRFELRSAETHLGLHVGAAFTLEDAENVSRRTFPEAWVKSDLTAVLTPETSLTQVVQGFASLTEAGDYRFDVETDLRFQVTTRFSVKSGFEVRWDARPAAGHEKLNASTHTMLVFSWGHRPARR